MKRVRLQALIELCVHWRYYAQCHCPLLEVMTSLVEFHPSKSLRPLLSRIETVMREGNTLSEALKLFPKVFDSVFVQLMQIAEQLGDYGVYLEKAENYLRWRLQVRQRIYEALRYPFILLSLLLILLMLVDHLLLPQFAQLLQALGGEHTSWVTTVFLSSLHFVPWMLIMGFILGMLLYQYDRTSLPLIGPVFCQIQFLTFTQQLGILLQSKVELISAIHIAAQSTTQPQKYEEIIQLINQGTGLSVAMHSILPKQSGLGRMIRLGEQTGQLDQILQRMSQMELEMVHHRVQQWLNLLQPGFVIIMGGILIGIICGVLWPIYQMLPTCG
jgi:type II secretory pathway component PulF